MTVFAFEEDDPQNPLLHVAPDEAARLPYGAAELGRDGKVVSYTDTEPGDFSAPRASLTGKDFFSEVVPRWASSTIVQEFRKGVDSGEMNVVFDCAVSRLPYKVRVHLKVSPILGTFWVFLKKLSRSSD